MEEGGGGVAIGVQGGDSKHAKTEVLDRRGVGGVRKPLCPSGIRR